MTEVLQMMKQVGLLNTECSASVAAVLQSACLSLLLSKVLGYLIIAGAFIVKVPQIVKILRNKSAAGLSNSMFILELIILTISSVYGYTNKFPFSTYGETIIVAVQNVIIVFLVFHYQTGNYALFFALMAGLGAFVYAGVFAIIPTVIINQLFAGNVAILIASRVPQIWANFQAKSTGQLAFLTFFLNFAGTGARVFTTLKEVNDVVLLGSYVISCFLNGVIVAQILAYGEKKTGTNSKTLAK